MDYREMNRMAANPQAVRTLAAVIKTRASADLSESMQAFLDDMAAYDGETRLSTRQLETLYGLRESTMRLAKAGPYLARDLVAQVYADRALLPSFEEEEWIAQLDAQAPETLTKGQWKMLLSLARGQGIIERGEWVDI